MSWDVYIIRAEGYASIDDLPKDYEPEPLGDARDLRMQLSELFSELGWTESAWGVLRDDKFSIEFNFSEAGNMKSFMLHVRGGGNPLGPIALMCKHFGWQAVDCSMGEFIDFKKTSQIGWQGFQDFRDQVIEQHREPRADTA